MKILIPFFGLIEPVKYKLSDLTILEKVWLVMGITLAFVFSVAIFYIDRIGVSIFSSSFVIALLVNFLMMILCSSKYNK